MRPARTLTEAAPAVAPERTLSVAFACGGWPPDRFANGVIRSVASVADGMAACGHRAVILAQQVRDHGDDDQILNLKHQARSPWARLLDSLEYRLRPDRPNHRRACRALVAATRQVATERAVELLEMEEAFGWARWVVPRVPVPVVVRLHGPWFLNGVASGFPQNAAFARRVRHEGQAIAAAAGVTAPSRDVLERTRAYYGLPLDRAEVIPNPVPVVTPERWWRRDAADPDLILFIGRFDRHKGGDVMIDAFARLGREFPRLRLRFIGPDRGVLDDAGRRWTLADYLRDRLPEPTLRDRVEWLGQRPNSELEGHRRQAAITVIASRYETFGLTVTEAMALGCPVVATRAGALAEIVCDGQTGLLCRPEDPADLAAKLGDLLRDPDAAARLGQQAGHDCITRFHPEVIARQLTDFYRRVLDR